jgi:Na+-driven multidrug efflux pump
VFSRLGSIVVAGLPSLLRQGLSGIAALLLNHATALHGDAALTAVSVVNRLFLLVFSICLGFGQGLMPVAGYNYGSGNLDRAKKAYRFALLSATGIMLAVSLPLGIFAPSIIGFFRNDPDVIRIGAYALRLQCAVLFTHGIVTCTIMFLQALGRSTPATILAGARQGIFFLPLILLLPTRFGLFGLILVQPLADLLTVIFSAFFAVFAAKRALKSKKRPH